MDLGTEQAMSRSNQLKAVNYAREEILIKLNRLGGIAALKSEFCGPPFTVSRRLTRVEHNLVRNLHRITNANENMSQAELSQISRDSFQLLAKLRGELVLKSHHLTRDVITAYVRNCCESINTPPLIVYQLDKLFPVREMRLKLAIKNLHLYALTLKENRPQIYLDYVVRFSKPMRILHGLGTDNDYPIRKCCKIVFKKIGSRALGNSGVDWAKTSLMLMILSNAVCDLIRRNLDENLDEKSEHIRIMIDYVTEETTSFISRHENWQYLKGVNRDTELPATHEVIPLHHLGYPSIDYDLFQNIPSLHSKLFAGVCQPPVPMPTPKTIARSEMLGKSVTDLHKYLEESSSHMKPKRKFGWG